MTDIEATGSVSSYRKPTREGNKSETNFQELFAANKTAKDLERRSEESNATGKSQIEDLEKLRVLKHLLRRLRESMKITCWLSWPLVEAIKEYKEIEAKTRDQAEKHASAIEVSQMEKQNMIDEVEDAKERGPRLMIIMSEISTLKSELKQVKKQEEHTDGLDSATLLESVLKELAATEKELEQLKGSFQFMASTDVIQDELKHAKASWKQHMRQMTSLVISNIKQLEAEAETHKKEKSLNSEETALVKAEIKKSEAEINMAEERLQAAVQDLKAAKPSEAMALENLKSTIKAELFRRETRDLRVEEGYEVHQTEGSKDSKKRVENDFEKWRQWMEPEKLPPDGKAMKKALKGHQQDQEWLGNLHFQ
ncbi:hypothetical protein SASPL_144941 [Salvia splendens]|uniref:Uncharacterized protein n=1 Tax=Salvia splendens TaxID=180675 RepID=A0A8X8WG86_SALSN|nr:hypothetical protein SASPL_144941 [Salvia splendens]